MKNTNRCKRCNFYRPIYLIQWYRPLKSDLSYCTFLQKMTEADDACEHFTEQIYEFDLSARRYEEAEADLRTIINLLRK